MIPMDVIVMQTEMIEEIRGFVWTIKEGNGV